jgi:hypothetical protein
MFGYSDLAPGKIKTSTDGAATWGEVPTLEATMGAADVLVTSAGRLVVQEVATSNGCQFDFSDDQGTVWNIVNFVVGDPNRGCILNGTNNGDRIMTFDGDTGYIIAQEDVWKSTNRGSSWTRITSGTGTARNVGTMMYDSTLGAGTSPNGSSGKWLYSTGGDGWTGITGAITVGCNGAWKMGGQLLVACQRAAGNGVDFRDTQGNIVIANPSLGAGSWTGSTANGFCFDLGEVCYMTIMDGATNRVTMFYSRNDGQTWTVMPAGTTGQPFTTNAGALYPTLHSFQSTNGGERIWFSGRISSTLNAVWRIDH